MEFVPLESGIEVSGKMVQAIVDGFGAFTILASEALLGEKLGTADKDGLAVLDREKWYPQEAWLRAFKRIGLSMGDQLLLQLGESMSRSLTLPPEVKDVRGAFEFLDALHHMYHRKDGREMLSPENRRMMEGIGHYGCEVVAGKKMITVTCNNPNSCAFDRGIVQALARRFIPAAQVVHDSAKPCRKTGASSCTYGISWS